MQLVSAILWRNLNAATIDTLNDRSKGQYDIRLGSADFNRFFEKMEWKNETPLGGYELSVPIEPYTSKANPSDSFPEHYLAVRYMGAKSSRKDWNIPSQRKTTAYPLWREGRRLPAKAMPNGFLVLLKTVDARYHARLILEDEVQYLPNDIQIQMKTKEVGYMIQSTVSQQAIDLYETLIREYNVLLYGPPGTGKTFLMQEVMQLFTHNTVPWRFDPGKEFGEATEPMLSPAIITPALTQESKTIWTTFHQSYSYEEFVLGITTEADETALMKLVPRPGILLELTEFARQPDCRSLLVADEINRGNVSKIFGEFITLMDLDKRLDADGRPTSNTVQLRLPYLKAGQSVEIPNDGAPLTFSNPMMMPRQVYVLASMNSVDCSIHPLDSALRRRFFRFDIWPDEALLSGHLHIDPQNQLFINDPENYDVDEIKRLAFLFWKMINRKISIFLGRDSQLGHSFLWGLANPDRPEQSANWFARALTHNILPQLKELFADQQEQIINILRLEENWPTPVQLITPTEQEESLGASPAIDWGENRAIPNSQIIKWVFLILQDEQIAKTPPATGTGTPTAGSMTI